MLIAAYSLLMLDQINNPLFELLDRLREYAVMITRIIRDHQLLIIG